MKEKICMFLKLCVGKFSTIESSCIQFQIDCFGCWPLLYVLLVISPTAIEFLLKGSVFGRHDDSILQCWKTKCTCRPFTSEGFAYQHSILRCFCGFNRNFVAFFMIRGFQFPVFEIEVWGACMHTNACASDRNVEKGMACSISIWCGFYKIGFQTDFKNPRFYKLVTHWTSVTSSREQQRTPVYCLFSFQQWKNIRDIFSRKANEIVYFLSNNERTSVTSSREQQTNPCVFSIFFPTMKENQVIALLLEQWRINRNTWIWIKLCWMTWGHLTAKFSKKPWKHQAGSTGLL
jgi:hypothetical protein